MSAHRRTACGRAVARHEMFHRHPVTVAGGPSPAVGPTARPHGRSGLAAGARGYEAGQRSDVVAATEALTSQITCAARELADNPSADVDQRLQDAQRRADALSKQARDTLD